VRDALPELKSRGITAIGISPDTPEQQRRFDEKFQFGFSLLSDADHRIAEAFAVWGEKKMYGKSFMGVIRSAFLIENGRISRSWYKISPKDTIPELLKALND